MEMVEFTAIDIRFEHTRHKDSDVERRLLSSIMERDIMEPLQVSVCKDTDAYVLLDGFKRYRCAKKLGKGIIPIHCIGDDVAEGVISLLRRESSRGLSTMEQAALIEELHKSYGLSICTIAVRLERSPAWVSVRLGMVGELSGLVRQKIMSGAFPARAYMYSIKRFTRVNGIPRDRVDAFVAAVSGKGLSTRELFVLSRAYFTGGPAIERLIREGDTRRAVRMLCTDPDGKDDAALSEGQQQFIKDLAATSAGITRIVANAADVGEGTAAFMQYVNLWSAAILKHLEEFKAVLHELYDRSGPCQRGADPVPSGSEPQVDSASVTH
jgi:hypothetical protein